MRAGEPSVWGATSGLEPLKQEQKTQMPPGHTGNIKQRSRPGGSGGLSVAVQLRPCFSASLEHAFDNSPLLS